MKGLRILAYHRVHPQRRGALCVTPDELEAQIRALLRRSRCEEKAELDCWRPPEPFHRAHTIERCLPGYRTLS